MSSKDKHITRPEDFLKYTANKMSREERYAFEKNLQKDPFEDEAAEGFSLISSEEAKRDISVLSSRIWKRTRSGSNLIWLRIAASVAVLVIVSGLFYTLIKNKIDKGTGQLIVTESSPPQKAEKDIPGLQNTLPQQPAGEKQTYAGPADTQKISESRISEVGRDNKSEAPENAARQEEKDDTIKENFDFVSRETAKPVAKSESEYNEMILPEKLGENLQGQGLINEHLKLKTVRGIVLSADDNTPLPGVNVLVKGSAQGTITDIHGLFTIPVIGDSAAILTAQYIGMEGKEIKLNDSSFVKIEMRPDVLSLQEVVVVGYGAKTRLNNNRSAKKDDQSQIMSSPPVPVNAFNDFNEYVRKNHVYPSTDLRISRAKVILNFLVRLDGRPDSIMVVKSPGEEFSLEAIRLLKEGPDWKPAIRDGKKVVEGVQVKIILDSTKQ